VDSARAIVARDLDQSDRFETVSGAMTEPPADPGQRNAGAIRQVFMGTRAADVLVVAEPAPGGVRITAFDVGTGAVLHEAVLREPASPGGRRAIHVAADEIVNGATGQRGVAATQLLFVRRGRIVRVDADGQGLAELRTAGNPALSPAWSPDARRFAYTAFVRSGQPIVIQDLDGTRRDVVPTTEEGLNITPVFAPDGRRLAFAHGTEGGTDIYLYDIARGSVDRLTVGRFADNLSPAWSPDGRKLAFISSRGQTPQLYVMNADGTGQEVLARFDYGATGTTSAPSWSPDGQLVAFHREVGGTPQLFVVDVATRAVRQLTGAGRNEDPAWAPDSRHLVFVSNRSGERELWVLDVETGRLRQLTRGGGARLPAWSPRLTTTGDSH
jgi:TolB protein